MSLRFVSMALCAAFTAFPLSGQACSTCGCGDNTITLMGVEKPFAGRLRTAVDFATRSESFGEDAEHHELDEDRTTLGLSWSPAADATIAVQVPYVHKHLAEASLEEVDARGLGDVDVTARMVIYRDAPQFSRHMAGFRVGMRLPTSEQVTAGDGTLVDIDAQPDAGALAPSLGAWYGYYNLPVFVSFSVAQMFYGHGHQQFDPGDAVIGSLTAQYGFGSLAVQLGLDGRSARNNVHEGVEDADSGGDLLSLAPGLAYRFGTDFVVNAGAQLPVYKRLNGAQDEKAGWRVGVAYDF